MKPSAPGGWDDCSPSSRLSGSCRRARCPCSSGMSKPPPQVRIDDLPLEEVTPALGARPSQCAAVELVETSSYPGGRAATPASASRRGEVRRRVAVRCRGRRQAVVEEARQRRWFLRRLRSNRLEGLETSASALQRSLKTLVHMPSKGRFQGRECRWSVPEFPVWQRYSAKQRCTLSLPLSPGSTPSSTTSPRSAAGP